jgi:hypothetical protein
MTEWKAGQRVKFFSKEKMNEVKGEVVAVREETIVIKWDDEDCRRVYDKDIHLAGRGTVEVINE